MDARQILTVNVSWQTRTRMAQRGMCRCEGQLFLCCRPLNNEPFGRCGQRRKRLVLFFSGSVSSTIFVSA